MIPPRRRIAVAVATVMMVTVLAAVGAGAIMAGGSRSDDARTSIRPSATTDPAPSAPQHFLGLPERPGVLAMPNDAAEQQAAKGGDSVEDVDGAPGDNGVTNGDGSEVIVQPAGSATDGLPGLAEPAPSDDAALIAAPLPRTASREGAIVDGFPIGVIPVLAGSVVRSSGVSSTSTTLQVSLVADSPRAPDDVLAFYRRTLVARGFAESVTPASAGSTAAGFTRGADQLVVTTTGGADDTGYSLFGTLRADTRG